MASRITPAFLASLTGLLLAGALSCSRTLPASLPETRPQPRTTSYSDALVRFGQMTEIFDAPELCVQSKDVVDRTGVPSGPGGIPFNVTEMLHSAVNRIGGRITYVPFDPQYLTSQVNTRYAELSGKARPHVVITGAITEYDRGLETRGDKAGIAADIPEAPDRGATVKAEIAASEEVSSITLDMNLIDFDTLAMLKQVQAVNTIKVSRVSRSADVSFSIFGPSFGLQGEVSKAHGRHAAVRLLVELNVLEVLGKHLALPYWTCVQGAQPDPVVVNKWKAAFRAADNPGRIRLAQKLLRGYGLTGIGLSGELDARTRKGLECAVQAGNCGPAGLDEAFLERLLLALPPFSGQAAPGLAECNAAIAALPAAREAASAPVAPLPALSLPAPEAAPAHPAAPATAPAPQAAPAHPAVPPAAPAPEAAPAPAVLPAQPAAPAAQDSREAFAEDLARGKAALEQRRYDQAREFLAQALAAKPDAEAHLYYIYALQFLGRDAELGEALKSALVVYPSDVRFYRLNVKHLLSQDRIREAGDSLRQGLAVQPGDPVLVMLQEYIGK